MNSASIETANIYVYKYFNVFSIFTLLDLYDKECVRLEINDGRIVDIGF